MRVVVAESAGFCFGVRRAVAMCEKAAGEHGRCVTLGPIIHNGHVIRDLEKKGVRSVSSVSEVPPGAAVVIRSHGAARSEHEALAALGATVIDATCPDVAKIHKIVRDEYESGRLPIIIGERSHPEVAAIAGWCGECEVFETPEELSSWLQAGDNAEKPVSVVFQTTNITKIYTSSVEIVKKECTNGKIFDTICKSTCRRRQEAAELSKTVDAMVVVGGRNSANSLRLSDACREHCRTVLFAECAEDLDGEALAACDVVGVTAGASTPAWIIEEVIRKMGEEIMSAENIEERAPQDVAADSPALGEATAQEQAGGEPVAWKIAASEPAASEAAAWEATAIETDVGNASAGDSGPLAVAATEPTTTATAAGVGGERHHAHETFEEMLEKSIKTLHTGDKVSGTVTSITGTEVSIDLGTKQSGYIPVSEFTDDAGASIEDVIKIGDVIESYVMRVNDVEGTVMLSKKRLDAVKNWGDIEAAKNNKTVVEGVVTEENRGGIVVNVKGVRVFVPASQTGVPKSATLTEMLKKTVKLRITEVNPSKRRVVGSIRDARDAERREKALNLWAEIEVGKQYTGIVKSMTSYGVFVDIGGVDGMIHVSELSWKRVRQPSEVVDIGDEIVVSVKEFDKERRKISLTCKKAEDNPWANFAAKHAVGDIVSVKIVKMMPFGAFAEICPGVDGLIHISQITDHRIGQPSEVLSDGQMVDVKITEIDMGKEKVSLSIRALMDSSSQPVSDKEAAEAAEADKTPVVVYDTDAPPEEDEPDDAEESEAEEPAAVDETAAEPDEPVAEAAPEEKDEDE
jgi:4-hydroxy-3-methylbut-2-enyl diphosphate reductase